jgi:GAF domain-containing protein
MIGNQNSQSDLPRLLHELHFSSEGLDSLLEQVTVMAADTVEADAGVGLTVIRDGNRSRTTVAASDQRTLDLDEIQYGNDDGPCLHSARTGDVVTVDDVATDQRWPDYLAKAAQCGLRSSLSIPLRLGGAVTGALNVYVFDDHRFDNAERAMLGQFADEASRAVSLALRHDDVTQTNDHLHTAMATRRVIDQAIGLIMAQNRCSADEAFGILRRASQHRNVKINQLAAELLHQVSGTKPDGNTHWRD